MDDVAVRPGNLNVISLCTGGGGLDLGLELAIPTARPVLCVEREAFAVAHLVAAMQQGWLAEAPVWSDVTTLSGRQWRGRVDGVIGGIPCQPHSLAGRRGGSDDERDLWSDARRIIVQSGAWWVLIENVRGMLSAKPGLDPGALRVRRDLQRLGFRVEAGLFTAAEVGASHERERLFILGVAEWAAVGLANCDELNDDRSGFRRQGRRRQPSDGSGGFSGDGLAISCGRFTERRRGAGDMVRSSREVEDEARQRKWGRDTSGDSSEELSGVGQADAYGTRSQGHRNARERPRERSVGQGGGQLVEARVDLVDSARNGRGEGRAEPAVRGRRRPLGGTVSAMGTTSGVGLADSEIARSGKLSVFAGRQDETGIDTDGKGGRMVDALSSGHRGQSPDQVRRQIERDADERSSDRSLFPPGPQATAEWAAITEHAPELLPAISRHDRFRIALRAALTAAHGDTEKRDWLDAQGPYGLRAAVVQEIAQSAVRSVADGVAESRVDWLRLLGNGVVPLEAAHAIRTLVTRLADRGCVGANELVRMMDVA